MGEQNKSNMLMCKRSSTLIFKNLSLYFLRLNLFMIELYMPWLFPGYLFCNHTYAHNNELDKLKTFLSMKLHVIRSFILRTAYAECCPNSLF